jgi:hypothetical protein
MNKLLLTLLLLSASSCAPSTNFFRIYPKKYKPKPETSEVAVIKDPPGKPYQLLGIVTAHGMQTEFIGNTATSTGDALFDQARQVGADALVKGKIESQSSYSVGRAGVTTSQQHVAVAYAIRWADPRDPTFIPGTVPVQSIIDSAETVAAKEQGLVSRAMLKSLTVGKTTKAEVLEMLGEPMNEMVMENFMYMETWTYRAKVLDQAWGIKEQIMNVQFNKNGIMSGKMSF